MSSKNVSHCIITFSILIILLAATSAEALIRIEPQARNLSIFSNMIFTVNVTISGINNVYGFQFDVGYNPSVLEIVSISESTFLNRSGQDRTFCVDINNTNPNFPNITNPGLVNDFACARIGTGEVNGSGVLANVTFRLKSVTSFPALSNLSLSEVKISDENTQPLSNTSENGQVRVYECLSGETRSCISGSQQGTRTCTSGNVWGSCIVTTAPGGSSPGGGGYIPPENESLNESENEGVYLNTDVIPNGCVDIQDLSLIGANFGLTTGFTAEADINQDGKVDIIDLVLVALDFGTGSSC